MKKKLYAFLIFGLSIAHATANAQSFISEGPWRGVFYQQNGTEVPFNFELKGRTVAEAKVYLVNGPEHFAASGITQKRRFSFYRF